MQPRRKTSGTTAERPVSSAHPRDIGQSKYYFRREVIGTIGPPPAPRMRRRLRHVVRFHGAVVQPRWGGGPAAIRHPAGGRRVNGRRGRRSGQLRGGAGGEIGSLNLDMTRRERTRLVAVRVL